MRRLRRCIRRSTARRIKDSLLSTMSVGLVLASSSAFAQNPPPPKPDAPTTQADEVELPGVDVQGQRQPEYKAIQSDNYKLPDLLKDTPQSITVVPQQHHARAGRLQPARCPAQRDRHQPGRRRGRRRPGRQPHAARLLRPQRHLHRRRARLRPVHARHLQPRVGGGAQGPVVGPVRPRLDRRRHQPGHARRRSSPRNYTFTGTVGTGPFSRATIDINQPVADTGRLPAQRLFTDAGVVGRDEAHLQTVGRGAILHHRAGDADPAQRQLLLPRRQQPARLRLPLRLRQAGRRRPEQLLRPARPRLREGPASTSAPSGRARVQ